MKVLSSRFCVISFISAITTLFTVILFLFLNKIAPFGNYTLVIADADIQYLDLFSYFKDIISGDKSVGYDFSKGLGGNTFAVFSYYLLSPVNLLLVFFDRSELHSFFTIAFLLKIILSSTFCSIFLAARFEHLRKLYIVLLSLGYSFSQYTILQAHNIMWLDGVYMLPLVLLGVYYAVNNKTVGVLSVSIGLSMIFNWYTGIINCLFSAVWMLFEVSYKNSSFKERFWGIGRYALEMLVGLLLCSFIFIPTYFELQNGKGGLDLWLLNTDFIGNIVSLLKGTLIGSKDAKGQLSLFSGTIALIGFSLYLARIVKEPSRRDKAVFLLLCITVLLFYWNPLVLVFSIFKKVDSYWYRYSYVAHISYIFIAAYMLSQVSRLKEYTLSLVKLGFLLGALLLVIAYSRNEEYKLIYITLFLYFCFVSILYTLSSKNKYVNLFSYSTLLFLSVLELEVNAGYIKGVRNDASDFISYSGSQNEFINKLKESDPDFYRVSQLKNRKVNSENITAYYLESLAYNYAGLNIYTSSSDKNQLDLLSNLGYPQYAGTLNVVNTSILPVDSLLNVKYILSDKDVKGLVKDEKISTKNGKFAYLNPYALPLAFTHYSNDKVNIEFSDNPFRNINSIYSYLVGRDVSIFRKVKYSINYSLNSLNVIFGDSAKDISFYGYIDTKKGVDGKLFLNDKFLTGYSKWLAPRVVYLGEQTGVDNILKLSAKNISSKDISSIEIYALDLNVFSEVISELRGMNLVEDVSVKNGYVNINLKQSSKNYSLFLTIPYNSGWTFKLNGEVINPKVVYDAFIQINLESGRSYQLEMSYSIPKLYLGLLLSLIGVLALIFLISWGKRVKKTNN
ncbi:MAG: YfhO family protein [Pasteurellaceae bacterium]|nr:YfhO family protein [Pasteurellaceae bacterium]